MATLRTLLIALACGASLGLVGTLGGCSGEDGYDFQGGGHVDPPPKLDRCADPAEGCPCNQAGAIASCGKLSESYDDYIVCSQGQTTCDGTRWSQCVENGSTYTRSISGLNLANIAEAPGACANACAQSCATYTDTPEGVDGGDGIVTNDGGLTLEPKPATTATSCTSLQITPNTAPSKDITVTNLNGANQKQFTAKLMPAGCFTGAVQPLWSIDRFDIAQIDETGMLRLITPIAGPIQVRAFVGNLSGSVISNVRINVRRLGSSAPSGSKTGDFPDNTENSATADAITPLYPYANTMFPLGLAPPLVQWRVATAATAVQISLRYPAGTTNSTALFAYGEVLAESQKAPVPLRDAQPRAQLDPAMWSAFEQTVNRNRAAHGATAEIVIRRLVNGTARASTKIPIQFAAGQLKGRLYYNSYGTSLVSNYSGARQSAGGAFPNGNFGAATLVVEPGNAQPSVVAGSAGSNGCRVCHSANAAGTTLVTAAEHNYDIYKYTLPGGANSYLSSSRLVFPAVNPTASRYFSSAGAFSGDNLSRLYDGAANVINDGTVFSDLKAGFPVFAHDGLAVAFTFRGGSSAPLGSITNGGNDGTLSMMRFDGDRTFSGFRNLHTPASGKAAWPSFLPPGQGGVVFSREIRTTPNGGFGYTRSDCDGTGSCNDQGATAELWWVSTGNTPVARRLDTLNGWSGNAGILPTGGNRHGGPGSDNTWYEQVYNYEPSVLPIVVGGYSWVAFTSRRMYGNIATINPYSSDPRYRDISIDPTPKKLWLAALDASPTPGTDPSHPALYFPGQELIAGNSRAVFALDACKVAGPPTSDNLCESDLDCCGAPVTSACVLDPPPLSNPPTRHCAALSGACKGDGEQCTADAQCCSFGNGSRCASGVCQVPPPVFFDATYTRDYVGTCDAGERPVWRLVEWQSTTPAGTSIRFAAQTRELPADPWVPTTPVNLGVAQAPPVTTSGWTHGGVTADKQLRGAGEFSRSWLRVTAELRASADRTTAPTLHAWRATYDCVAAE